MEETLSSVLKNSSIPLLSAFILGLMTAISHCPLATNITAVGFSGVLYFGMLIPMNLSIGLYYVIIIYL